MIQTCRACDGTGNFDTKFTGSKACECCKATGKQKVYWPQYQCYNCDGLGKEVRFLQGETEDEKGEIEFSCTEYYLPCESCNGKGTVPINPLTFMMKLFKKFTDN